MIGTPSGEFHHKVGVHPWSVVPASRTSWQSPMEKSMKAQAPAVLLSKRAITFQTVHAGLDDLHRHFTTEWLDLLSPIDLTKSTLP